MVETAVLKSTVVQVGVCLLANCAALSSGMVVGFPSNIIPPLLAQGASMQEVSLVGSICFLPAVVTSLLAGPLLDHYGRTRSLQVVNVMLMIGWLLLAKWPYSYLMIYAGRVFGGVGMGLSGCCVATYTAEITSTNIRTALVTLPPVMLSVGTFLSYLGALIYKESWTEVSYCGVGLTILTLALSPMLPESPLWLVSRDLKEEACRQLMILRGASRPEDVSAELHSLTNRPQDHAGWLAIDRLKRPEAYKPLVILNLFFLFQQLAGVGIVIQYGVTFARDAGVPTQPYLVALGIGAVRMAAAGLTTWACSLYGRRRPALVTGIVMTLSVLALCVTSSASPGVACSLILLYVLSSSIGFSTLPWSMLGELFPTSVRGLASGITTALVYVESFIAAQLYPNMVYQVGSGPVLLFFGISGLLGTVFIFKYLPETHGKTLAEIEDLFKEVKLKKIDAEMGVVNKENTED